MVQVAHPMESKRATWKYLFKKEWVQARFPQAYKQHANCQGIRGWMDRAIGQIQTPQKSFLEAKFSNKGAMGETFL